MQIFGQNTGHLPRCIMGWGQSWERWGEDCVNRLSRFRAMLSVIPVLESSSSKLLSLDIQFPSFANGVRCPILRVLKDPGNSGDRPLPPFLECLIVFFSTIKEVEFNLKPRRIIDKLGFVN